MATSGGTVSATSTFTGGGEAGFSSMVAGKVLDAAKMAKEEKKKQKKLEKEGYTIPESEKKGLFAKALKDQFISKPYRDLKKNWNNKVGKGAEFVGLFSDRGENFLNKFKMKRGRKFSDKFNYIAPEKEEETKGGGGGGPLGGSGLGEIALDIQMIANSMSALTSLMNTQLGTIFKISGNLAEIKKILSEQIGIQQEQAQQQQTNSRELSLEQSDISGGSVAAVSTLQEGSGIAGLIFKVLKQVLAPLLARLAPLLAPIGGLAAMVAGGGLLGLIAAEAIKNKKPFSQSMPQSTKPFVPPTMGGTSQVRGPSYLRQGDPRRWKYEHPGKPIPQNILDQINQMPSAGPWDPRPAKHASGAIISHASGAMIGEAGPEMVTSLTSAAGQSALGGDNNELQDAYQQPYNAVAGSMLAVTKDFVEGLGPVGQSVAPNIQGEVSRLGKVFDVPQSNTKINMGGAGLQSYANAGKEGKKYMEDLIKGTLEKLAPNKKNKDSQSSGGGSSLPPAPPDLTDPDSPAGSPPGGTQQPTGQQPTGKPQAPTAKQVAANNTNQLNSQQGLGTTGMEMVTGENDGSYFYDHLGNILKKNADGKSVSLSKQSIKTGVPGGLGGNYHFFRDLRSGRVSIATHNDVHDEGWYDYAANAVRENVNGRTRWVPVAESRKYKSQFNSQTNPYGKSTIKAEKGIRVGEGGGPGPRNMSVQLLTSGGGTSPLSTPVSFNQLKPHHGTGDARRAFGITKDYILDGPAYPNYKVLTPVDATVKFAGDKGDGYGNSVELTDDKGKNLALFGHFNKVLVQTGQKITAGTALGIQGTTGRSTGNHVHIDASKKFHEAWANYTLGMKNNLDASSLIYSDDNKTGEDSANPSSSNPFEDLQNLIQNVAAGTAVSALGDTGQLKSVEDVNNTYKRFLADAKSVPFKATSATTPTSPTKQEPKSKPAIVHLPVSGGGQTPTTIGPRQPTGTSQPGGSSEPSGSSTGATLGHNGSLNK